MDALIVLFIIIGIVNALNSSKKKKRQGARKHAFQQMQSARPDRMRQTAGEGAAAPGQPPRAQVRREKREDVEAHRVHTTEDLQAHLASMEAQRFAQPWSDTPPEAAASSALRASAPIAGSQLSMHEHPYDGEGGVSTQGESEAEHAEHRRRVAAEEQARRLERETLRELRAANLDKLRSAVIMSEVLGRPVSLRPRAGYHR